MWTFGLQKMRINSCSSKLPGFWYFVMPVLNTDRLSKWILKRHFKGFPVDPVSKSLHSQGMGPRFDPWSEIDPMCCNED